MIDDDRFITDTELARLTGTGRSTWQKRRLHGGSSTPPYVKLGNSVRYRLSDVKAWLNAQVRSSTSDPGQQAA